MVGPEMGNGPNATMAAWLPDHKSVRFDWRAV